ncbi:MAG: J domain-containing protein [Archangium sp.]|nr:J domain-containing protein [Archangium sp.]
MRSAKSVTLENVDVECTHCGVTMSSSTGGGGTIRYFQCPKCQRWVSSMYTEVFRADTKVRTRSAGQVAPTANVFGGVKERLEAWLKSLDSKNPYSVLGCLESDSDEVIRDRYRALARKHHPDAGGDDATMRSLNEAWETIVLERRAQSPYAIRRATLAHSVG